MMNHQNQTLYRRGSMALLLGIGIAGALSAPPSVARACGGFFCNRQAIDQSGENILFVRNADGTVTTVVQILYQGPSEEFAWILPVPAEPTVAVGTDALFQGLASTTTPRFTTLYETVGACRAEPSCPDSYDDDLAYEGARDGAARADAGLADPSPGVDVRLRANVGPYDVAVLAAGSADALRTWLSDNGYLIPESAGAELDHYVELEMFFVALRLIKDRSSGDIQPIVLTSSNDEPCIPIRLTRIATVPNMPVTAYFLGTQRARPMNYLLVEADLEDEGLWLGRTSYQDSVTRVVNDAGGHAFVTDYAGTVPSLSLSLGDIEALRSLTDPAEFLRSLQSAGFSGDSQLLGILLRLMPPPAMYESEPQTFYNCLAQGWCSIDVAAWAIEVGFHASELVDALNTAIVTPRREAQRMLDSQPHLTRLFTTLSADEMTEDPQFMTSGELAATHTNIHQAVNRTECGPEYFRWTAPRTLILPSGREVREYEGIAYRGNDEEYCADRSSGDFRPGISEERLRAAATERELSAGGGGARCSVRPAVGGASAMVLVSLAGLALLWRRRKTR